jgi:hypothetical protein
MQRDPTVIRRRRRVPRTHSDGRQADTRQGPLLAECCPRLPEADWRHPLQSGLTDEPPTQVCKEQFATFSTASISRT